MYIAAGQGQTTPGDKILMSTETSCHLGHLLQVSKKSLKSDFIHFFFHDFIHVVSSRAGADNPLWTKFDANRNILSLRLFVEKFKKISLKSDFIQFFHDIIHVYSPGAEADSLRGQSFDVNRNVLSLHSFVASFKKMSSKSDRFYTILSRFNTSL